MQVVESRSRPFAQLVLAGLIMVALLALTDSDPSSEPTRHPRLYRPVEAETARRIDALLAGIPQRGSTLGDRGAPVTLQFFADLECEEARQFVIGALPFLIRRWVREGKLRIVYRANPEETIWPDIFQGQQVATLAAGVQGRAWSYLDFFYHAEGPEVGRYATEHSRRAIAAHVPGLDISQWSDDRLEPALVRHLERDLRLASRRSIEHTPAFLIGPSGERPKPLPHFSLTESAAFDEAIESML